MTLLVDASVEVKWLFTEPDSDDAAAHLSEHLIAPTGFRLECANAVIRRLRRSEVDSDQAVFLMREVA